MDLIYRYDPYLPVQQTTTADADGAIRALGEGNLRMSEIVRRMQRATLGDGVGEEFVIPVSPISLGLPLWEGSVLTQAPYALFLGCSDARVPIEQLFDQAFNNLFVVRIAGNVLGTECLGSIDYAVRHFSESLRLMVVLGHTGCGAVTAAVDTYLSPRDYADIAFTHSLRSLVNRLMVAVRGAAKTFERICGHEITHHPNYRHALIDLSVFINAAVTAADLRRETQTLCAGSIRVVFGVCNLGNLIVRSIPGPITDEFLSSMFCAAPESTEQLSDLSGRLAKGILAEHTLD